MAEMPTQIGKKYRFDHTDGRFNIVIVRHTDEFGLHLIENLGGCSRLWSDMYVDDWEGEFTLMELPKESFLFNLAKAIFCLVILIPRIVFWIVAGLCRWVFVSKPTLSLVPKHPDLHPVPAEIELPEQDLHPVPAEPKVCRCRQIKKLLENPFDKELLMEVCPDEKNREAVDKVLLEPLRVETRRTAKWAASLILNAFPKISGELGIPKKEAFKRMSPEVLISIQSLFEDEMISSNGREDLIRAVIKEPDKYNDVIEIYDYAWQNGIILEKNEGQLDEWCEQVIVENEKVAADVRGGKQAAVGRLIGEVMKLAQKRADPKEVRVKLLEKLS